MKLRFQKAEVSDLPLLYKLAEEIWIPTFAPLFSETQLRALYSGMYNDEKLTRWLNQAENELYFIYSEERAIGYFGIEKHPPVLTLDKIYIHPELQGQGLGLQTMVEVELLAVTSDLKRIQLRVNRFNSSAISFYERRQFRIIESIDIPGPDGFVYEDYRMEKVLE